MNSIRLLIVDDHAFLRKGIIAELREHEEKFKQFSCIMQADSQLSAVKMTKEHRPNLVLLDLTLPKTSSDTSSNATVSCGLDTIQRIKAEDPSIKILVISAQDEQPFPSKAFEAGACGFISKEGPAGEIYTAIEAVHKGERYISSGISTSIKSDNPLDVLTQTQFSIFMLLADCKKPKQIAEMKCISSKTVSSHRDNILKRLNLKNTSEIVELAHRLKLKA